MATLKLRRNKKVERCEHTLDMFEEEQMFKEEDLIYSDPNRAIYMDEKKTL